MLKNIQLEHILFLDIETVPLYKEHDEMDETSQVLWEAKSRYQRKNDYTSEEFYNRAGIWAEFGKIVCISVGIFSFREGKRRFRVTSFSGEEPELLLKFKELVERYFSKEHHQLCAHNGKEFDFPYIARRMVIHGIDIPTKLSLFGKKPWEVAHIDTMELWKFGDYKHFTSLKLLTYILNIPSPKDDIDGSEVFRVYYEENDINRIIRYCEKDTIAVAQVLLRFRNEPILSDDELVVI